MTFGGKTIKVLLIVNFNLVNKVIRYWLTLDHHGYYITTTVTSSKIEILTAIRFLLVKKLQASTNSQGVV